MPSQLPSSSSSLSSPQSPSSPPSPPSPQVVIVPVSHVSPDSRKNAVSTIIDRNPGIVAVELDHKRFVAIMSLCQQGCVRAPPPIRFHEPFASLVERLIFGAQEWFGKKTGQAPGMEFRDAVRAAAKVGARIALIDQDISITLKHLTKCLSVRSVARMVAYALAGKEVPFDINRIPGTHTVELLVAQLRTEFPGIHKALVLDRDVVMAKRLVHLSENHPDDVIVAVMGAGHVPGISARLKLAKKDFEVLG